MCKMTLSARPGPAEGPSSTSVRVEVLADCHTQESYEQEGEDYRRKELSRSHLSTKQIDCNYYVTVSILNFDTELAIRKTRVTKVVTKRRRRKVDYSSSDDVATSVDEVGVDEC